MLNSKNRLTLITYYGIRTYRNYKLVDVDRGPYSLRVAVSLRNAKFYSHNKPDSEKAVKCYRTALLHAKEDGLDELSDAILGIWAVFAEYAAFLPSDNMAVSILESRRSDILRWMEVNGDNIHLAGERTRLLNWAVRFGSRIAGIYYERGSTGDQLCEEYRVWCVETTVAELLRRQTEGVKPDEGEFLNADEIGALLAALGDLYYDQRKFHFASPLFLRALTIKPTRDCEDVMLMNSLASSLVQQMQPSDPNYLSNVASSRAWLEKALELGGNVKPPQRTIKCDDGCTAVIINLGNFAELEKNFTEARARYEEALSLASAINPKRYWDVAATMLEALGEYGKDETRRSGRRPPRPSGPEPLFSSS
ncbi:MAG: hypothetical protein M1828_000803 [Chrysothrix sp. TS-e1954]|nr:MAG: hypothetical protein M1828_000803 [Chrysothrix sp. TS-e1954]